MRFLLIVLSIICVSWEVVGDDLILDPVAVGTVVEAPTHPAENEVVLDEVIAGRRLSRSNIWMHHHGVVEFELPDQAAIDTLDLTESNFTAVLRLHMTYKYGGGSFTIELCNMADDQEDGTIAVEDWEDTTEDPYTPIVSVDYDLSDPLYSLDGTDVTEYIVNDLWGGSSAVGTTSGFVLVVSNIEARTQNHRTWWQDSYPVIAINKIDTTIVDTDTDTDSDTDSDSESDSGYDAGTSGTDAGISSDAGAAVGDIQGCDCTSVKAAPAYASFLQLLSVVW